MKASTCFGNVFVYPAQLNGKVSQHWEQLLWIPSDRSEEFRVADAGTYFYTVFIVLSCFNSKKNVWFGRFSFDSHPANECQPHHSSTAVINAQRLLAVRSSRRKTLFRVQRIWNNGGSLAAVDFTLALLIWGATCLLKNQSYMYKTDGWEWSSAVTHHSQSDCKTRRKKLSKHDL